MRHSSAIDPSQPTSAPRRDPPWVAGAGNVAFGLRLLALAVVSASGAFLPQLAAERAAWIAGIVGGTVLGTLQYLALVRGMRWVKAPFVVAQVAVWTYLLDLSGGLRSPLFAGMILEIPLAAVVASHRGSLFAAGLGAIACFVLDAWIDPPLVASDLALAIGALAIAAFITRLLIVTIERQQEQIAASRAVLHSRAENLAEELRLLGDYLMGALVGIDDLGRIASINTAGAELLGRARETLLGMPWQEALPLDQRGSIAVLGTLVDGNSQRGIDVTLECQGRPRSLCAELWAGPSAQGRRTYLLLEARTHENGEADPLRRLGEAVACVSHQIKNSIHALQGFARDIDRQLGDRPDPRRSVDEMVRAVQSLGALADDVLAMSGAPRAPHERIPVSGWIASASALARSPGAQVRLALPDEECYVRGHRGQLVHALFNLLDNACRVTPRHEAVDVRVTAWNGAEARAPQVAIEVIDSGPGLPVGIELEKGRARSASGNGYGLLAARRYLEQNGATLVFERRQVGTCCRILLPADLEAATPVAVEQ